MNCIQIYWTCGNIEEAREIAQYLIEKKLVACANIIPHVESIFEWDNKINVEKEVKVIFKTKETLFDEVQRVILQKATYDVPEILQVVIAKGNPKYLEWVQASTKPF